MYSFTGGSNGGNGPHLCSLTVDGSNLYGMTTYGGSSGYGTIFKFNTNDHSFNILHSFAGGGDDGRQPYGSLTLSGSTLYGMTSEGGNSDKGTLFKIDTNGTGFGVIHWFMSGTEGAYPWGSFTRDGSVLYGVTSGGGSSDMGTVFRINTDSNDFTTLYSFNGETDGSGPSGCLTLIGSTLYGMAYQGGSNDKGTIFSLDTSENSFNVLHSFVGRYSDGELPYNCNLPFSGSTMYGMTSEGGSIGFGIVFSMIIPEPSTLTLFSIGTIGLLAYACRRRRA